MVKKLTKFGNSRALIIDKPILRLLNISDDTSLTITIQDNSLIITPVNKEDKSKKITEKKLERVVKKIIKEYAPVLKKLADS